MVWFIIALSEFPPQSDDIRIFDGNDDKIDGNDESINLMASGKSN